MQLTDIWPKKIIVNWELGTLISTLYLELLFTNIVFVIQM